MLKGNLTCAIVNQLLTFFVEDNMDKRYRDMVSTHLRNCPMCMERYTVVKKLYNEAERKRKLIKKQEMMQEEISEYLDGEMSEKDIVHFEQKLSTTPQYEEALIATMKLKRLLNNSFYKVKYNLSTDLTDGTIEKLKNSAGFFMKFKNLFSHLFQR